MLRVGDFMTVFMNLLRGSFSIVFFCSSLNSLAYDEHCMTTQEGFSRGCARLTHLDSQCELSEVQTFAFDVNYCLNDSEDLISAIVSEPFPKASNDLGEFEKFKNWQEFPEDILLGNDTRKIAVSLISRMYNQREKMRNFQMDQSNLKYALFDDTKVLMTVPTSLLSKISKNGFLNTHQTKTSSAWLDPEWRTRRESMFFRLRFPVTTKKIKAISDELSPKYAYVIPKTGVKYLGPSIMANYSDAIVVFKDQVKMRSTVTQDDSLFGPGSFGLSDTEDLGFMLPPVTFYSLNHKTNSGFGDTWFQNKSPDLGYIEAQIWGKLTFDDVDYIILGCYQKLSSVEIDKAIKQIPKEIPVFGCSANWSNHRNQYTPGVSLR